MCRFKRVFFQMVLIFFIGYTLPDSAQADSPESKSPEPEKKIELTPPAENTDELFKAAAALAEKDPEEAVRLYRRALLSKPDVWEERRKMARLYEKLEKTDAALTEFEALNHAMGTAQSHGDLVRILEKKGMLPPAAVIALRGAQKFPEDDALAASAGTLLLKAGQVDRAAEFLEKSVQKQSGNKNLLFLLGQALEQQGHQASALKAYLKSMDAGTVGEAHEKAFQRLAVHAVKVEKLWVFPPRGWEKNGNTLSRSMEDEQIHIDVYPESDMNEISLKVVREKMPPGMFDDEQMKQYEAMRETAAEILKTSPDAAKDLMTERLPVFHTKPLTDKIKGLMAFASTSQAPEAFMQSVCSLVLPSGNKVYALTWVSSKPVQEGENMVLSLIDHIVLPE